MSYLIQLPCIHLPERKLNFLSKQDFILQPILWCGFHPIRSFVLIFVVRFQGDIIERYTKTTRETYLKIYLALYDSEGFIMRKIVYKLFSYIKSAVGNNVGCPDFTGTFYETGFVYIFRTFSGTEFIVTLSVVYLLFSTLTSKVYFSVHISEHKKNVSNTYVYKEKKFVFWLWKIKSFLRTTTFSLPK